MLTSRTRERFLLQSSDSVHQLEQKKAHSDAIATSTLKSSRTAAATTTTQQQQPASVTLKGTMESFFPDLQHGGSAPLPPSVIAGAIYRGSTPSPTPGGGGETLSQAGKLPTNHSSSNTASALSAAANQGKVVDPCVVLQCDLHHATQPTQMHLGGKGITALHPNMLYFSNIEGLVLTNNKLTKLEGLLPKHSGASAGGGAAKNSSSSATTVKASHNDSRGNHSTSGAAGQTSSPRNNEASKKGHKDLTNAIKGCSRLRRLFLGENRLTTLLGDIQELAYLEVLILRDNQLSNMEATSKQLRHLQYLTQLDLTGNPLCEEQGYRLYMVHHHPSVDVLDCRAVTAEERQEAEVAAKERRRAEKKARQLSGSVATESVASSAHAATSRLPHAKGNPTIAVTAAAALPTLSKSAAPALKGSAADGNNATAPSSSPKRLTKGVLFAGTHAETQPHSGGIALAMHPTASSASSSDPLQPHGGGAPAGPTFAFGSTYVPHATTTIVRPNALSASAALVESKVKQILMKRSADEMRQSTLAQSQFNDMSEQRRAFHGVWELAKQGAFSGGGGGGATSATVAPPAVTTKGAAPPPVATAASASVNLPAGSATVALSASQPVSRVATLDVHQSHLYRRALTDTDADVIPCSKVLTRDEASQRHVEGVQQLVALAREAEQANDAGDTDRYQRLIGQIQAQRHAMIPPRLNDDFATALSAQVQSKDAVLRLDAYRRTLGDLFFQAGDAAQLNRLFAAAVPSSSGAGAVSPTPVEGGSLSVSSLSCGSAVVSLKNVSKVIGALENGDALTASLNLSLLDNAIASSDVFKKFQAERAAVAAATQSNNNNNKSGNNKAGSNAGNSVAAELSVERVLWCLVHYLPFVEARRDLYAQTAFTYSSTKKDEALAKQWFQLYQAANHHAILLAKNGASAQVITTLKSM